MDLPKAPFLAALLIAVTLAAGASPAAAGAAPSLAYETTLSGYTLDSGRGVAMAPDGSATVIGQMIGDTEDNDFLVARVDAEGEVLWTFTVEASEHDYASDLAVDDAGDVHLCGWTDSADFPRVGGLQQSLTGFRDAFVMKLDGDDGSIVFSTLIGGDYVDQGEGIALGPDGTIYLSGGTESTDFPTVNAYQEEINSPPYHYADVFLTRLSADATTILYSTHLGGSDDERLAQIALGPAGEMILAGWTESTDFPLADPIQPNAGGGPTDLFVAVLSPDGSALDFATYVGGEGSDSFDALAVDAEGGIYLTGSTQSVDYPTTAGAFQEEFVGEVLGCEIPFGGRFNCSDAFVTRIRPDRGGLAYSTFLGGSEPDEARDLAVDAQGNAYVVGYSRSTDFPGDDSLLSASIFVSRLSSDGSDLAYTHLKPSGSANAGHGIAVDGGGNVVFTGSADVPADTYVAKLAGGAALSVGIGDTPEVGEVVRRFSSAPNPFNPSTSIRFELERASEVRLRIYDARGARVRTLVSGRRGPGVHRVQWDGRDEEGRSTASGVYLAELRAAGEQRVRKLALVR